MELHLAAMDGMTHAAFRSICFEYGANGASTEMIPAVSYGRARKKRIPRFAALLSRRAEETFLAAQIIGSIPEDMAKAAVRLESLNRFDAIDINMGCPARKVVGSGNGASLLTNVPLACSVIKAVCESTSLPVRLKLRLGWDDAHITAPEIARFAQDAGCSAIILHGRTREMMYKGEADPESMLKVRNAVSIPFFANGGVYTAEDAERFLKETRADGIFIGRAALKQPWIFEDIRNLENGLPAKERGAEERITLLLKICERYCLLVPEIYAVREMRKFCSWYLPGLSGSKDILLKINQCSGRDDYNKILSDYLDDLIRKGDTLCRQTFLTLDTRNYDMF